jgi:hypothetical protein
VNNHRITNGNQFYYSFIDLGTVSEQLEDKMRNGENKLTVTLKNQSLPPEQNVVF